MRISNNVNPTPEEVIEWGYDEELILIEQDEDLILRDSAYISPLLQLASDDKCPKQQDAFLILCQFSRESVLRKRQSDIDSLVDARRAALPSKEVLVREWCVYIGRLLGYGKAPLLDQHAALVTAHDLLVGPGRVGAVRLSERELPGCWEFVLIKSISEYLYIEHATGHFSYSIFDPLPSVPRSG